MIEGGEIPQIAGTATACAAMPAAPVGTTFYACLTSRYTFTRVSVTTRPACPTLTVPLQCHGSRARAGQRWACLRHVDFGFEICCTDVKPEKFAMARYTLTTTCVGCSG